MGKILNYKDVNDIGRNKILASERLGEVRKNKHGTEMKIIRYRITSDITVEFQDENKHQVNTTYSNFKKGIFNPYDKVICGVGCTGIGEYRMFINGTHIHTDEYVSWYNMICRCYKDKRATAYKDCYVCDEWLNFQNYAKWYSYNFYDIGDGRMHLDKDILIKGNRVYSPETCIFVPQRINMVFMKKHRNTDSDLPTGINRCVRGFRSTYNGKSLGISKTLEEAVNRYNKEKRIHINQLVDDYKEKIPTIICDILLSW